MVAEYYLSGNVWLPSALRGHFLDLCSAFKLAIHNLSFQAISRNVQLFMRKVMLMWKIILMHSTICNRLVGGSTKQRSGGARVLDRD
jgi:hypothetical protein